MKLIIQIIIMASQIIYLIELNCKLYKVDENYMSIGHVSNEDWDNESAESSCRVANGHDGAGEIRGDIDVIDVVAGEHSGHEHGTQRHKHYRQMAITSRPTDSDEAQRRQQ